MARQEFSGAGRIWINGTLIGFAENVSVKSGDKGQRIVTLAGVTGNTSADPTHCMISVKGAVPKSATQVKKIVRYRQLAQDVTIKVLVGDMTTTAIGKITDSDQSTQPGKSEFNFDFDGDEQPQPAPSL